MKKFNFFTKENLSKISFLAVSVIFISSPVFGATFKDVPNTSEAYYSIDKISEKGIMVGDLNGNFNPNSYIDKFDTSKILAKFMGYNLSEDTEDDYNKIYEKYENLIKKYSSSTQNWNYSSNREIAFLLDKGVYTAYDLSQFIVKNDKGEEQLRALSKEELAVFICRMIGKEKEAGLYFYNSLFKDDSIINENKKQYIYYATSLNLLPVNGETFEPKSAITRGTLSIVLDRAYDFRKNENISSENTVKEEPIKEIKSTENVNVLDIQQKTLKVANVYKNQNSIEFEGEKVNEIFKFSENIIVTLNGVLSTLDKIENGMIVDVIFKNNYISEIKINTNLEKTIITGYIKYISINPKNAYIGISESLDKNVITLYDVSLEDINLYSVKLNDKVTLQMKDEQVHSMEVVK